MGNIYKGTLGLIGNTPLVEVVNVEKELGLEATLLVKLEYFNPAGSVKDRIADTADNCKILTFYSMYFQSFCTDHILNSFYVFITCSWF